MGRMGERGFLLSFWSATMPAPPRRRRSSRPHRWGLRLHIAPIAMSHSRGMAASQDTAPFAAGDAHPLRLSDQGVFDQVGADEPPENSEREDELLALSTPKLPSSMTIPMEPSR